jgi:hypothetical protein
MLYTVTKLEIKATGAKPFLLIILEEKCHYTVIHIYLLAAENQKVLIFLKNLY